MGRDAISVLNDVVAHPVLTYSEGSGMFQMLLAAHAQFIQQPVGHLQEQGDTSFSGMCH